jgi:hypothetical protein
VTLFAFFRQQSLGTFRPISQRWLAILPILKGRDHFYIAVEVLSQGSKLLDPRPRDDCGYLLRTINGPQTHGNFKA